MSFGQDTTNDPANSECWEHILITASFGNASENNKVVHISNVNDETRINSPDEVSELSVPEARFDRQPHTHHMMIGHTTRTNQIPKFPTGRIYHHATHHHTNIRTCQHKYHRTTTYQWLNKHQKSTTSTQAIPLIV